MNFCFWKKKPKVASAEICEDTYSRLSDRREVPHECFRRLWSCIARGNSSVLTLEEIENLLDYIMSLEVATMKEEQGPATEAFEVLVCSGGWNELAVSSGEMSKKTGQASPEDLAAMSNFLRDQKI